MTTEAVRKLNDGDIEKQIQAAQAELHKQAEIILSSRTELKERAQKRHDDAMAEIVRIAAENAVDLHDLVKGKNGSKKAHRSYKVGDRYQHPEEPDKVWTVGSGRPPNWIDKAKKVG